MSIIDEIKSCRQINGVDVRCVMVTPQVAEKLLKANIHNRKLSNATVSKYANEMLNEEWLLSASGIGFDRDGVLCDGQHRLNAIIESGATVPMLIAYGLAPASQEKVDRQKKRSLFDVFSLAGYASKPKEVQIAIMICLWNRRKEHMRAGLVSDSEVKSCLDCHRESITEIINRGSLKEKGIGRVGFLSAVVLYHEIAPKKAIDFLDSVSTGAMLTLDDPAMRLRKYLIGDGGYVKASQVKRGGSAQFSDFRRSIFAINAFHDNRKITAIKEADEFKIKSENESV